MNKVDLIGTVAFPPRLHTFSGGKRKASFLMRTDEKHSQTLEIVSWDHIEAVTALNAGDRVEVTASIRRRGRDVEGKTVYVVEIVTSADPVVTEPTHDRGTPERATEPPQSRETRPAPEYKDYGEDDIPFRRSPLGVDSTKMAAKHGVVMWSHGWTKPRHASNRSSTRSETSPQRPATRRPSASSVSVSGSAR